MWGLGQSPGRVKITIYWGLKVFRCARLVLSSLVSELQKQTFAIQTLILHTATLGLGLSCKVHPRHTREGDFL